MLVLGCVMVHEWCQRRVQGWCSQQLHPTRAGMRAAVWHAAELAAWCRHEAHAAGRQLGQATDARDGLPSSCAAATGHWSAGSSPAQLPTSMGIFCGSSPGPRWYTAPATLPARSPLTEMYQRPLGSSRRCTLLDCTSLKRWSSENLRGHRCRVKPRWMQRACSAGAGALGTHQAVGIQQGGLPGSVRCQCTVEGLAMASASWARGCSYAGQAVPLPGTAHTAPLPELQL
jgi:hypothetical protein